MTEIVEQKIVSGCKNPFRTFYIAVMHYGVWLLIFLRKEQMQMKLVLAEKPSVAQSIAKVLGAAKREDGYLEGNGYVVSWCVGHLVELAQPEVYDAKYSKWAYGIHLRSAGNGKNAWGTSSDHLLYCCQWRF